MKFKLPLILAFSVIFLNSCKKEETPTSTWQLAEQLMDPGDGSGVFVPVSSNKVIEFFEDGTVTSTGDLCAMDIGTDLASTGEFFSADSTLIGDECATNGFPVQVELAGGGLILSYQCFEGCQEKYIQMIID